MKIIEFTPEHTDALLAGLATITWRAPLLRIPAFMRHYFCSSPAGRLFLLMERDGTVAATLGSERIRVQLAGRCYDAAVLSNTYSIRPGAFAFLYLNWMKAAELGVAFPGNAGLREMLGSQQRWRSVPGLRTYWLNWSYPAAAQDPAWKTALKPVMRRLARVDATRFPARIARLAGRALRVVEERRITDDMAKRAGSFGFRLAADPDYLNWRFCTTLDYVKYRVFRILDAQATTGYVVLAEWPHCVIVSHCDGDDPAELALGVLLAISAVNRGDARYRKVLLTSMHAGMQAIFHRFGFRPNPGETSFSVAVLGSHQVAIEPGVDWLVNMDFGDAAMVAGMVFKP